MAGCSSSFGASNVVISRNEVVWRNMWSQNFIFDGVRFRISAKEVALPIFWGKSSFRNRVDSFSVKNDWNFVVMSMSQPQPEWQSGLGAVTVSNEGGDAAVGKETRILESEDGVKTDNDGNEREVLDGSGGNGKYPNGRGGGGGGGGNGDGEDGEEEEEFGPIMKFEEVMKETEARGASLPLDMLEAAKSVGIRKVLLLRYLDLQV
jgi:hypothetical protein